MAQGCNGWTRCAGSPGFQLPHHPPPTHTPPAPSMRYQYIITGQGKRGAGGQHCVRGGWGRSAWRPTDRHKRLSSKLSRPTPPTTCDNHCRSSAHGYSPSSRILTARVGWHQQQGKGPRGAEGGGRERGPRGKRVTNTKVYQRSGQNSTVRVLVLQHQRCQCSTAATSGPNGGKGVHCIPSCKQMVWGMEGRQGKGGGSGDTGHAKAWPLVGTYMKECSYMVGTGPSMVVLHFSQR